jgi:hypothetical protein
MLRWEPPAQLNRKIAELGDPLVPSMLRGLCRRAITAKSSHHDYSNRAAALQVDLEDAQAQVKLAKAAHERLHGITAVEYAETHAVEPAKGEDLEHARNAALNDCRASRRLLYTKWLRIKGARESELSRVSARTTEHNDAAKTWAHLLRYAADYIAGGHDRQELAAQLHKT